MSSYCIVTDGDAGGSDLDVPRKEMAEIRRVEQTAAAKCVGVDDLHLLGYPDGRVEPTLDLRRDVSRVIREVRPQRVVTQSPERSYARVYASHPDHLATGEATLCAVYPDSRNPFAHPELLDEGYEPWTVSELWISALRTPDVFVDITDAIDRKIEALLQPREPAPGPRAGSTASSATGVVVTGEGRRVSPRAASRRATSASDTAPDGSRRDVDGQPTMTLRMTSPAFIASKPSLMSSSGMVFDTMWSRSSRPVLDEAARGAGSRGAPGPSRRPMPSSRFSWSTSGMLGTRDLLVEARHADRDRGAAGRARALNACVIVVGRADHLERVVGAAAAGERLHLGDDVAVGGIDDVGRTERQRRVALQLHRVDRDDPAGAGDPAPWMTAWPTPPQPMTATLEPGFDLRGVERGADAGGHAAADQRELLVGQVGVDLARPTSRRTVIISANVPSPVIAGSFVPSAASARSVAMTM